MGELTITEFLEARIAEDEELAKSASSAPWDLRGGNEWLFPFGFSIGADDDIRGVDAEHIARHDPARVLAECAAKRAIIKAHPIVDDVYEVSTRVKYGYACSTCFSYGDIVEDHGYCDTLRALAAVYSSHPDYDTGWAL